MQRTKERPLLQVPLLHLHNASIGALRDDRGKISSDSSSDEAVGRRLVEEGLLVDEAKDLFHMCVNPSDTLAP